jgi:hypothetical protein
MNPEESELSKAVAQFIRGDLSSVMGGLGLLILMGGIGLLMSFLLVLDHKQKMEKIRNVAPISSLVEKR